MQFELYKDQELFYTRLPSGIRTVQWQRESGNWKCVRGEIPQSALVVRFDELPSDLQEEILAVITRAQAVGGADWGNKN